uniref:mediator of DNA damage checkpoint protein 1 isoform X2 n=1 Tax=Pristiophorus japonicus TaxID=55135 RepID=UPI00398F8094
MDQTQLLNWDPEEAQEEEEKLRASDREPMGRLRVFAGSQRPETDYMVYRGENVIGRHESCHVHIPVQSVSKKHAVIEIDGDSHLIHDCNSLNKTRRKNAILKPHVRYTIDDGDLFLFADVACQYLLPPPAEDGDSGSETGSESMFPQARSGTGTDQQEARLESGDMIPEAADSDEDSLLLPPTQPYQPKSSMSLLSDTYVKESEDDDTPWKGTGSFTSQDDQHPKASVCQTPLAHVVPESDDEGGDSSRSNLQSMQLHYDSDTDLEEDQQPDENRTEPSNEQSVDCNNVSSKTGGVEQQEADNTALVTGVVAVNHLHPAEETANHCPGEALDRDTGKVSSRVPEASAPADLLLHFSRDSDSELEGEQQSVMSTGGSTARTKMDSGLAISADTDAQEAAANPGSLIAADEEGESSKAGRCADGNADTEGEAKETAGGADKRELSDINSDTDIDDDSSESYALQPTQCYTLTVSSTLDETAGEGDYTPDAGIAAGANTEEESTQLFICHSPTFNKGPFKGGAAAASSAEEEAMQPFTFKSPAFGKDPFRGGAAAASSVEEEATQPFIFQSPTFGKDPFKGGAAAASSTEEEATQLFTFQTPAFSKGSLRGGAAAASSTEEEATQPFIFQSPTFGKDPFKGGAAAASSVEEEATQPFIFQSPTFGKDPFKEPFTSGFDRESQLEKAKGGAAAASGAEEEATQPFVADAVTLCPVATAARQRDPSEPGEEDLSESNCEGQRAAEETQPLCLQKQAAEPERAAEHEEAFIAQGTVPAASAEDGPAPTLEEQPEGSTEEESGTDPPAVTEQQPEAPEGGERGCSQPVNEEVNSRAPADQQAAQAGKEVNGEPSGDAAPAQTAGDSPASGGGEAAAPGTEEGSTETPAPNPAPSRAGGRRGRRSAAETGGGRQGEMAVPGDKSGRRSARSAAASNGRSQEAGGNARRGKRRKASEASAEEVDVAAAQGREAGGNARRGKRRKASEASAEEVDVAAGQGREAGGNARRGKRRKASEASAEEVDVAAAQGREAGGNVRCQRRKAPEVSAEEVATATPAGRPKRGRGRPTVSATITDDNRCLPEEERPQIPSARGRRSKQKSMAAPQSQAESVEIASQTDSLPNQRPAGRGRRKQECTQPSSQETGLPSGRKRRTRATSPSDSEKEPSTTPPVTTRRRAGRQSSRTSAGSVPESVAPPKIMFTGLVDENGEKVIKQLGGEVVESVHDSTHLVTDRIRRTVKFLCAVARGIPVVTPEWLIKCGKSSCFLPTSSFLVDDSEQEQKFNFKLAESLQKAKEQLLLQDYRVHMTAGVLPEPSQMDSIVQCSGATVLPKMPRAYKEKTLVISCPDDLPKCKAARDAGIPVVSAEFILTGILQQTADLASYRLDGGGNGVVDSKPENKGRKRSSTAAATQPVSGKKRRR